ncbi:hypothetical protein CAPTEDRAFT_192651 [Capitella teleta]|uniref:SERTA domain-containing protein n=1 Tax=Capitella teleta TaxID=283909 RepID=R7UJR2_CAPTE|nr:hypothetical protein CAPTEDRAFT_192651 [Capitella teleta]|eukprot:ELU03487.1 hypothetical protein CAPTEDRAFT_192651 [Capitella teleta]
MCMESGGRRRPLIYVPSPYALCASSLNCEDAMPSSPPLLPSPPPPPPSAPHPPPPPHASSSLKRKHDVMELETDERQLVLNISMHKLHEANFSRRTEQSLCRSVLIFNTLKHLENMPPPLSPPPPPPPPPTPPPPPVVKADPVVKPIVDNLCDLDLSWLDFELSPKLPSLSAEDLRHGLLPSNMEPLATSPSCHPKKDFDELDHVMEILVDEVLTYYQGKCEDAAAFFNSIYCHFERVASAINVEPSQPRRSAKQQHRSNAPADSIEEYYLRTRAIPSMDYVIQELKEDLCLFRNLF